MFNKTKLRGGIREETSGEKGFFGGDWQPITTVSLVSRRPSPPPGPPLPAPGAPAPGLLSLAWRLGGRSRVSWLPLASEGSRSTGALT